MAPSVAVAGWVIRDRMVVGERLVAAEQRQEVNKEYLEHLSKQLNEINERITMLQLDLTAHMGKTCTVK